MDMMADVTTPGWMEMVTEGWMMETTEGEAETFPQALKNVTNDTAAFPNENEIIASTAVTSACLNYMFALNAIIALPMALFGLVSNMSLRPGSHGTMTGY